jgi:hypothetical protein
MSDNPNDPEPVDPVPAPPPVDPEPDAEPDAEPADDDSANQSG